MVTSIPGSDILTTGLNVISQSLLIPVIIILLIFVVYSVITIGGIISEYTSRKIPVSRIKDLINEISSASSSNELKKIIFSSELPKSQKDLLGEIIESENLKFKSRAVLSRRLIENEEDIIEKTVEKTDIITRIGPTLGLMGTLIPMGPGLAALGSGDINTLAQAIIVAFDTTVVGIGAGAVAYVVSKIRRRWYDEYLANLDALSDAILDFYNP